MTTRPRNQRDANERVAVAGELNPLGALIWKCRITRTGGLDDVAKANVGVEDRAAAVAIGLAHDAAIVVVVGWYGCVRFKIDRDIADIHRADDVATSVFRIVGQ